MHANGVNGKHGCSLRIVVHKSEMKQRWEEGVVYTVTQTKRNFKFSVSRFQLLQ